MPRFLPVGKEAKGAARFLLAALPALGAVLTALAITGDLVGRMARNHTLASFGAFGFVWAMFFIETGVSALGGFGALAGARFSEAVGATVARFGADVIIAGFVGAGVTEVVGAVAVIAVVGPDGCVAVIGVIGATGPIPAAGFVGAAAVIATTGPVGVATVGAVIVGTAATSVPPADGYRAAIVSTDQVFASLQRAIRAASSTCFRHDSRTAT